MEQQRGCCPTRVGNACAGPAADIVVIEVYRAQLLRHCYPFQPIMAVKPCNEMDNQSLQPCEASLFLSLRIDKKVLNPGTEIFRGRKSSRSCMRKSGHATLLL